MHMEENFLAPWTLSLKNKKMAQIYDKKYYKINKKKFFFCQVFIIVFLITMLLYNLLQEDLDALPTILYGANLLVDLLLISMESKFPVIFNLVPFIYVSSFMAMQIRLQLLVSKDCNMTYKSADGSVVLIVSGFLMGIVLFIGSQMIKFWMIKVAMLVIILEIFIELNGVASFSS